jgi:hypothetical protein
MCAAIYSASLFSFHLLSCSRMGAAHVFTITLPPYVCADTEHIKDCAADTGQRDVQKTTSRSERDHTAAGAV